MKKLIISPHVDDEVLGCGGILDDTCFVYLCGIDESRLPHDPKHRIPMPERMKELEDTASFLGFQFEVNTQTKVNYFVEQDIKDALERIINEQRPDMIFLPHAGYNQDHRTVFHASQIALRPHDKNFFVKKVLVYEAVHDMWWSDRPFSPTYFVPIDVERKINAYKLQESQVRGMRSPEMLRDLAKIRGAMSHCETAEAFEVLRWVE